MTKKITRSAANNASDKLTDNLYKIYMFGDLLSAADENLEHESRARAGETILELAGDAKKAMNILENRRMDIEKLNSEKTLAPVVSIEPKGGAS